MNKFIKEEVEVMLKEHPKNQAKLTEVELKKEEYQTRLDYAGIVYKEDENETIESMQLGGQAYDSVYSNTNKISDKVFDTTKDYKKESVHINREDRGFLENKLIELAKLKDELDKKIVRIDNVLNQLSNEEKYIINTYYMKKSKWDYVSQQYCIEFQKPKSINQLLNIRDNAIKEILEILNFGN